MSFAMSVSRSPPSLPKIPMLPRTPPTWCSFQSIDASDVVSAAEPPAIYEDHLTTEADVLKKLWRRRSGFSKCPCRRLARTLHRPPFRRSAGNARRHRALRRDLTTYWSCMAPPGAALEPRYDRADAAAKAESVQLHEGHVGGGFGVRGELYPEDILVCAAALAVSPAGQMDRGPPRASDRNQSFA